MADGNSQESSAGFAVQQGAGGRKQFFKSVWTENTLLAALIGIFLWRGFLPAWRTLNTDFPNYYLAARLYRKGHPVDRLYDWIWVQRQKDHEGIQRGSVGFLPYTLLSALPVLPFSSLPPLAAKRRWLVINLILLGLTAYVIARMTNLGARRVAILTFLAIDPLSANFLYGQFYVLMLFLLTLAAWWYLEGRPVACGTALALGTALKIYPILFIFYFLRKKEWRAAAAMIAGLLGLAVLSIVLFGYEANRVFAQNVLPRAMAGEIIDPYSVHWNSLTALLRRLFTGEPELNPQPLIPSPTAYAFLQALCQALLFVLFLWMIGSTRAEPGKEKLAWGGYVALLLVLSTTVASYHHCALILAVALAAEGLRSSQQSKAIGVLIVLYALACLPLHRWMARFESGWQMFLGVPRLYAMLALSAFLFWKLASWDYAAFSSRLRSREAILFGLLFLGVAGTGFAFNLRHLRGQFANYASRLVVTRGSLLAIEPTAAGDRVLFTAMAPERYVISAYRGSALTQFDFGADAFHPVSISGPARAWVELASTRSRIVRFSLGSQTTATNQLPVEADDAEQPVVSLDGKWLAFIREREGRGSLWAKDLHPTNGGAQTTAGVREILDASYDVRDLAFFPDQRLAFAAEPSGHSTLFVIDLSSRVISPLSEPAVRARYPAVSPDGKWLAYSQEHRGTWQIWIMNLTSGEKLSLTSGECNSVTPAWFPDSKTLTYASDCGRGLGLTALCRIRAVP